jgi:DNA-binding PadR family transcriptional regulator
MFGMSEFERQCEGRWAVGRHGRGRHGRGLRWGGRHGMGGDDDSRRAGRMLAQGDLRLIALALIAEQPRHGYQLIKLLEEKTQGGYSPSPGIVYPTLTYLEETGYLTSQADGAKRLYTITAEGRTQLKENRAFVDALLARLAAAGERFMRSREKPDDGRHGPRVPRLVRAALENLHEVAAERLKDDAEAEAKVVEVLARAAADLRRT